MHSSLSSTKNMLIASSSKPTDSNFYFGGNVLLHLPLNTFDFSDVRLNAYGVGFLASGTVTADYRNNVYRGYKIAGDGAINLLNSDALPLYLQNNDWTIAYWFKPAVQNNDHIISFKGNASQGFTIYRNTTQSWNMLNDSGSNFTTNVGNLDSVGLWSHYLWTYNFASRTVQLYINGNFISQATSFRCPVGLTGTVNNIGWRYTGGSSTDRMNGSLDNLTIWAKYFTQPQVTAAFQFLGGF